MLSQYDLTSSLSEVSITSPKYLHISFEGVRKHNPMGLEKEINHNMAANSRVLRKIDQLSKRSVDMQVKCRAAFYSQPEGFSELVGKAPVRHAAHA